MTRTRVLLALSLLCAVVLDVRASLDKLSENRVSVLSLHDGLRNPMSPFLYMARNDAKELQRQLLWPRATFPIDSFVTVTR